MSHRSLFLETRLLFECVCLVNINLSDFIKAEAHYFPLSEEAVGHPGPLRMNEWPRVQPGGGLIS